MLKILIRRELIDNILTFRLMAAFGLIVVLSTLSSVVASYNFSRRVSDYKSEMREIREQLGTATVYSQLRPDIVVPPNPLSVFCKGVDKTAGQKMQTRLDFKHPSIWQIGAAENSLMKIFTEIDLTILVALLYSFLALILAFDGICGEKESGTLRLVLSNPVPRGTYIISKLLSGFISLWLPLAVAFLLSLIIFQSNPDIAFDGNDWVRLALWFAFACLFLGQIYALGLMISSFVNHSATALIFCLFGWLIGGVGYLNVLPSLSRYAIEARPYQEFLAQRGEVQKRYDQALTEWEQANPSPRDVYLRGMKASSRIRYGHSKGYEWLQEKNMFSINKLLEATDQIYSYQSANYRPLAQQAYTIDEWAVLSPFSNFKVMAKRLMGTTLDDKFVLLRAGHQYREAIIEFFNARRAFEDRRWFTDDPVAQEPLIPKPEEVTPEMLDPGSPFMKERLAWMEQQEIKNENNSSRELDMSGLPKFGSDWKRSLAESLATMTPNVIVLFLSSGVFVLICFVRFLRYDPR